MLKDIWSAKNGQGEPSSSGNADFAEEVGLDWTRPKKASQQHHTPGTDLEPAVEEKEMSAL